METLSDLTFEAAMAGYLVALICYAIEFASRRALAPTAIETASVQHRAVAKQRVGSGTVDTLEQPDTAGPDDPDGHLAGGSGYTDDDDEWDDRPRTDWGALFGRAAVVVTVVGVVANVVSVVARGIAAGRLPLANMYEFSAFICAAAVLAWLVVLTQTRARTVGLFVMTPIALLAFLAGTTLWQPVGPIPPSLNSYWKWIHVTTVSASGSVLLVSGAASVMYLLRHRYDRRLAANPDDPALIGSVWSRLPALPMLDKIAYRTAIVAFPVYTFAIVAGALWAEAAWGRYWGWDPKETVAFVSWVFYAGYLHARATSGWRGVRSTWINILGFVAIVFNLFFVNYVVSGLHSYAS